MTQITHGLRSILSWPQAFELFSEALGAKRARAELVQRYLRTNPGDAVLDIGCGTAAILKALSADVAYTGFDPSEAYIARARDQFGDRATFICSPVAESPSLPRNHFDIAMAIGVLHHLDDSEAEKLFDVAYDALKPGGRFVSCDPVLNAQGQGRIARWIILQDRGRNVRRQSGYEALGQKRFQDVRSSVRHDFIRIPYTHLFMECRKGIRAAAGGMQLRRF